MTVLASLSGPLHGQQKQGASSSKTRPPSTDTPGTKTNPQARSARIGLDTSENLFIVFAALNSCGFDVELNDSTPTRTSVRTDIMSSVKQSASAAESRDKLCSYMREKQLPDSARSVAQYVSLALNLNSSPILAPSIRDADLPPDAGQIIGILPSLQDFAAKTSLHAIWLKHQAEYEAELAKLQSPITNLLQSVDYYLKLPISGVFQHPFIVYVEPLGAPGQVNARNYSSDYYLVVSPGTTPPNLNIVRHAYLHYVLDEVVLNRPIAIQRLEPMMLQARRAPVEQSYKDDTSLMVAESLIRAIEARTRVYPKGKSAREV